MDETENLAAPLPRERLRVDTPITGKVIWHACKEAAKMRASRSE
jgi:hypothetical protein